MAYIFQLTLALTCRPLYRRTASYIIRIIIIIGRLSLMIIWNRSILTLLWSVVTATINHNLITSATFWTWLSWILVDLWFRSNTCPPLMLCWTHLTLQQWIICKWMSSRCCHSSYIPYSSYYTHLLLCCSTLKIQIMSVVILIVVVWCLVIWVIAILPNRFKSLMIALHPCCYISVSLWCVTLRRLCIV